MSDAAEQERQPQAAPEQPLPKREELVLLVLILADRAWLDDIVTVLLDVGATGATVLDSQGLGAILRREMPIFAGLASLIPERTGSHVILSAVTPEVADAVFAYIEEERRTAERPIVFTTPILRWAGLKV